MMNMSTSPSTKTTSYSMLLSTGNVASFELYFVFNATNTLPNNRNLIWNFMVRIYNNYGLNIILNNLQIF